MELTKELMDAILSCVEGVFLIEEESHIVQYANHFWNDDFPGGIVGRKCHEVFACKSAPCDICPPLYALECDEPYAWDFFDALHNRWLKIKNRLVMIDGIRYRVGNVNVVEDMMGLSRDAVKEMGILAHEISEYERDGARLEYESAHDKMTLLLNRNQFIRDLYTDKSPSATLGVLFFDLNNLKAVNDLYRHAAGDRLLCRMASAIASVQHEELRAYRIGGDEFVVLYKDCTQVQLDECRAAILSELALLNRDEKLPCITAVGSAWGENVVDTEELVSVADKRMYIDKQRLKSKKQESNNAVTLYETQIL